MLHKIVSPAIISLGKKKNLVSKRVELEPSTNKHAYLQSFQCFKCKGLHLLEIVHILSRLYFPRALTMTFSKT